VKAIPLKQRFQDFVKERLTEGPCSVRDLVADFQEAGYRPPTINSAGRLISSIPGTFISSKRVGHSAALWSISEND
jgi:hypothetical protein